MKRSIRVLFCSLLATAALAACGNKGDLVLPDPPEPPAKEAAAGP